MVNKTAQWASGESLGSGRADAHTPNPQAGISVYSYPLSSGKVALGQGYYDTPGPGHSYIITLSNPALRMRIHFPAALAPVSQRAARSRKKTL